MYYLYSSTKSELMAVEKVKEYLRTYHMEERILEFDVSSATAELAAQAVGCEPEYARLQ